VKHLIYGLLRRWYNRQPTTEPLDPTIVRRILILRYDAIGDMIVTLPMIDYLHELCPNTRVDIVSSPSNDQILENESSVSRRFVFRRTLSSFLALKRQMPREGYDLVFSLVINKTTLAGFLANTLGGRRSTTVSFEHPGRRELYQTWFNVQMPHARGVDVMTVMQLRLAGHVFGAVPDVRKYPLRLSLSAQNRDFALSAVSWMAGLKIILNISAGNPYRMWSEERNAAFIELLFTIGVPISISICGHGDRFSMAQRLADTFDERVRVLPQGSFLDTAACVAEADVVITPDTSMVHAASALGTPVLVMFTKKATFIGEWMPYGVPFTYVITDDREDLESIAPMEVLQAFQTFLPQLREVPL
jgi:ADP-heptose:LPS heptosyltransferase